MAKPYTPTMSRLRDEYVALRAEHYGFADLYAEEWDRALAEHDRETAERAWGEGLMAERTARGASEAFGFEIAPEPNPYTKMETPDE